jgi:hypothetical protein
MSWKTGWVLAVACYSVAMVLLCAVLDGASPMWCAPMIFLSMGSGFFFGRTLPVIQD